MLPRSQDLMVGRRAELARVAGWLDDGRHRVTVVGPGGIGKTRLAWELARERGGNTVFVDLTSTRTRDDLVAAVAAALGLPKGDSSELLGRVAERLERRAPDLMILDNFEHVASHAEVIDAWPVPILATSREALGRGEVLDLGPLTADHAVELLLDRVPRYGTAPDAATANAIVERVEWIPLAIELAAARLDLMNPGELLRRLDERFAVLGGGRGRHATLRATLDWSWSLLDVAERSALAQCSVFVGGFTLEAAEAVLDAESVLDALQGLVRKSLIRRMDDRFGMLETVREFAAEHLDDRSVFERHATYYAVHGDAAEDQQNLYAAIDREPPDAQFVQLMRRVNLLVTRGRGYPWFADHLTRTDTIEEASEGLIELLQYRGSALRWGQDIDGAEPHYRRALELARALDNPRQIGMSLGYLADLESVRGNYPQVAENYGAILRLARSTRDRKLEAMALNARATDYHGRVGDHGAAIRDKRAALEIFEELEDGNWIAQTRSSLAEVLLRTGEWSEATDLVQEAIAHFRVHAGDRYMVTAIGRLGRIRHAVGDLEGAREAYIEACQLANSLLDAYIEAFYAAMMALLACEIGEAPEPWRERVERCLSDSDPRSAEVRRMAEFACSRAPFDFQAEPTVEVICRRILDSDAQAVQLEPDGFRTADGAHVDLSRRASLAGIVTRLGAGPATRQELFDAGWPGETLVAKSARNRVYVALSTLRKQGLPVDRMEDGRYVIGVPVRRQP